MNTMFPWHYAGSPRGFRKFRLASTCLLLNTAHLIVYVTAVIAVARYAPRLLP